MEAVRKRADSLVGLLRPNLGLISSHVVEFLTGSLFNRLPENIRSEIEASEQSEVFDLFWRHGSGEKIGSGSPLGNFLDNILSAIECTSSRPEEVVPAIRAVNLDKFASMKKGHEVEIMSRVVGSLADLAGASHVVDVGAGKGYLSAHLVFHYNLHVLAVDCSSSKTAAASNRARKMQRVGMDRRKGIDLNNSPQNEMDQPVASTKTDLKNNYKQITQMVDHETCLTSLIKEYFPADKLCGMGLVGLHGCGDLSPCLVHHFATKIAPSMSKGQSFLAIVPCCYHLLESWPKSNYMKQLGFTLPENAFMHASKPLRRLAANKTLCGDVLMWRAILEVIFLEKYEGTRFKVGRIASKASSFNDYVKLAFQRINISLTMTDAEIEQYLLKYKDLENKMNIYFLVLSSLSTAIEATILIDLLLYLKEQP